MEFHYSSHLPVRGMGLRVDVVGCVQGKKAYKALRARKDMNIASRQHSQLLQQVRCLGHT